MLTIIAILVLVIALIAIATNPEAVGEILRFGVGCVGALVVLAIVGVFVLLVMYAP